MSELPKCPTYMAHPQSVWFETHWRPILESSLEQNKKLEQKLSTLMSVEIVALKERGELNRVIVERDQLKKELSVMSKVLEAHSTPNYIKFEALVAERDQLKAELAEAHAEIEDMKVVYYDIVKMFDAAGTEDVRMNIQQWLENNADILKEKDDETFHTLAQRDHALESVRMAYEALYCNDKCLGGVDCYCGMEEIIKKIRERHNL